MSWQGLQSVPETSFTSENRRNLPTGFAPFLPSQVLNGI